MPATAAAASYWLTTATCSRLWIEITDDGALELLGGLAYATKPLSPERPRFKVKVS